LYAAVRALWYWLPVVILAAMIVGAATDQLSSEHSVSWLERILDGSVSYVWIAFWNVIIRKMSHVSEYALLAALAFRAARAGRPGFTTRWAQTAFAVAVAVAAIDELRQSTMRYRSGRWQDVVVDACGAALALMVIRWMAPRFLGASAVTAGE
jgi:hypothetical protein